MKLKRDYRDYLRDILIHAEAAIEFAAKFNNAHELEGDLRSYWAVVRALEVIGEAARHFPADFKKSHSEIFWRGMSGMRDKVIHDYFGVDAEVVWRTVKDDLPELCSKVREILEQDKEPDHR